MSLTLLTILWLDKKGIKFFSQAIDFGFLVWRYSFLALSLRCYGHPLNKFWGVDKLLFGIIAGSLALLLSIVFHAFLIKRNNGKVDFPFQKVVIPFLLLIILSIIFSFVC